MLWNWDMCFPARYLAERLFLMQNENGLANRDSKQ